MAFHGIVAMVGKLRIEPLVQGVDAFRAAITPVDTDAIEIAIVASRLSFFKMTLYEE